MKIEKEKLDRLVAINKKLEHLAAAADNARNQATSVSINYREGVQENGSGDIMAAIDKAIDLDAVAGELKHEKDGILSDLIAALAPVKDPIERRVTLLRYGKGLYWKEIGDAVGYSLWAVYRMNQDVLRRICDFGDDNAAE